jgi:FAD dependent oxidoreductase TIGR03364
MSKKTAIVIGAGIVGLAHARALAIKGYAVTVIERSLQACGASIRNFGMVWPVGQPSGLLYQRAMRSRAIWKELCDEAGIWYEEAGSLHVATHLFEAQVMQELAAVYGPERGVQWLNASQCENVSKAVNTRRAIGGLYSQHELIVESREAIVQLPALLEAKYGVQFVFGKAVTSVEGNKVCSAGLKWEADLVFVCSGADFETLYPELFGSLPVTKCKLQMMRLEPQPGPWQMGAAICGGLSLIHYKSFEVAPSLSLLKKHYENTLPEYLQWGIHVMACQNNAGAITVGDTHEYGLQLDPFEKARLNYLILQYLKTFSHFPQKRIQQSWHGIYAKMTDGSTEFIANPEDTVWIVNGLGGAGMTLSFGLAEEVVAQL